MYFYRTGNKIKIGGELVPITDIKLVDYSDNGVSKKVFIYNKSSSYPILLSSLEKEDGSSYNSWNEVEAVISIDAVDSTFTSQTFTGNFNLSTGGEVSYKIYSTNTALTPTVSTPLVDNSAARIVIDAGASASLVATNLGTKRVGSDDFTVSKQNELLVFVFPDGTDGALVKSYTIKVLN